MYLTQQQIRKLILDIYPTIFKDGEISPLVFMGQIIAESSGDTDAFVPDSNGGSYGLFQIDKVFLKEWGFDSNTNLYDAGINTHVALTHMKRIFNGLVGNKSIVSLQYNLRVAMMFVCWNCGPGNYNMMYKNHLSKHLDWDWNEFIQNDSFVSNWWNCLNYPVKVFYYSNTLFGLPIQSSIQIQSLAKPVCLFPQGALGPYKIIN